MRRLRREGTRREPISIFPRRRSSRISAWSKPCATAYQGKLTLVSTMLQAAQAKGLTTAAIGKFGAAFIQDYKRGGIILDEDAAMPLGFAKELQQAGYPLPRNSVNAYEAGALTLANDNGDPTASIAHSAAQGWTDRQSARLQRRALPARLRLPDRCVRELHPAQQEAGPDDLLVEGAGRHESRVRAWNVQLRSTRPG